MATLIDERPEDINEEEEITTFDTALNQRKLRKSQPLKQKL